MRWMDREWSTLNLTQIEGAPDRRSVRPGMAFYSGSGPRGTICGGCSHLGETGGKSKPRCAKFRELAGRRGEVVNPRNPSCKYFAAKGRP
jgi:hypothetical protein